MARKTSPPSLPNRSWALAACWSRQLYVADEVVTAFGRLGDWFASERVFDCQPDVLVLAKGITTGCVPLGATLISDEIYEAISRPQCEGGVFSMGLTCFGHPVACAAALKNIEIMEREDLLSNAVTVGAFLQGDAQRLHDLPCVGDVCGKGLMLAVDLVADKATKAPLPVNARAGERVFKKCVDNDVIVRPVGDRIVLSPPIIISTDRCSEIVGAIGDAIQSTKLV